MIHSIADNLEAVNSVTESAVRGPYHILLFTFHFHFLYFLKKQLYCVPVLNSPANYAGDLGQTCGFNPTHIP